MQNSSSLFQRVLALGMLGTVMLLLNSCETAGPSSVATSTAQSFSEGGMNRTAAKGRYVPGADAAAGTRSQESKRPGLGTKAGWEQRDEVFRTAFYRQSSSPDAIASFHYNDEAGAKAMADLLGGGVKRTGLFEAAGRRLRVGLVRYSNETYPRLDTGSRQIVMGRPGSSYEIRLENRTSHRIEAVVSVDGLNVMTGGAASPSHRGYVIEAHGSVNIQGFRVNDTRVKSFEFSSVDASLAASKGAARNVGVVGLAVFDEDEAKAKMMLRREQFQREDADAFPVIGR